MGKRREKERRQKKGKEKRSRTVFLGIRRIHRIYNRCEHGSSNRYNNIVIKDMTMKQCELIPEIRKLILLYLMFYVGNTNVFQQMSNIFVYSLI